MSIEKNNITEFLKLTRLDLKSYPTIILTPLLSLTGADIIGFRDFILM